MLTALSFRPLATATLLLLLALTALAGDGCRRQAADLQAVKSTLPPVVGSAVAVATAAAAETLFVFCHPDSSKAGLSAAYQVASDTNTTNDDRTEMMAWQPSNAVCLQLPYRVAALEGLACPSPWVRDLLRPPRLLGA